MVVKVVLTLSLLSTFILGCGGGGSSSSIVSSIVDAVDDAVGDVVADIEESIGGGWEVDV